MPRQLTQSGVPDMPVLRPQANPTDVFVRPGSAQGSALGQLAAALSSVSPELRNLTGAVAQKDAEKNAALGEAWASDQQASKDAWSKLVADGKVSPSQNPHFIIAAKRKLGQVAASQFDVTLQQNIAKLGDAPTADSFEQAVADARSSYLKGTAGASTDLAFMQGFNQLADQSIDSARRAFARDNAKQFELTASRAYFQTAHAMADQAIAQGKTVDDIAGMLNSESAAWAGVNPAAKRTGTLTPTTLENINSEVLFTLMKSTGNPQLVQALAKKVKNGDGSLYDSAAFQSKVHEWSDHVTEDRVRKEASDFQAEQRAGADAKDAAESTLLDRWRKGGAVDTSDVEAQLASVGVKDAKAFVAKTLDKLPDIDPTNYVNFRSRIYKRNMPSMDELDAAATAHRISASQYSQLVGEMEQVNSANAALRTAGAATTDGIWSHPAMKVLEDGIRAAAKSKAKVDMMGNIISYTGFTENDVQQSITDGKRFLATWLAQNWTKYGSGDAAVQQAASAWRGFALQHGVINANEAGMADKVLPASPGAARQVERNAARQQSAPQRTTSAPPLNSKAAPGYSRAEIQRMRTEIAGLRSGADIAAWASQGRNREILRQLGDPTGAALGTALAEAERKAQ